MTKTEILRLQNGDEVHASHANGCWRYAVKYHTDLYTRVRLRRLEPGCPNVIILSEQSKERFHLVKNCPLMGRRYSMPSNLPPGVLDDDWVNTDEDDFEDDQN